MVGDCLRTGTAQLPVPGLIARRVAMAPYPNGAGTAVIRDLNNSIQGHAEYLKRQKEEEEVKAKSEEEEPVVQTKAQGKPKASGNLSNRIKQSSGSGQPLPPEVEDFFSTNVGMVHQ